jgi:DNA-binding HxlR family transcriptional regulator
VVTRPPSEHDEAECQALVPVFSLLGKRWTGLIVNSLLSGPARFSELKRTVPGVTDQMLSERLNELTEAGLVEREVVEGPPVGTRYALTPRGEGLRAALEALEDWATEHLAPT